LATGKILVLEFSTLSPAFPDLNDVSFIGSSGEFLAVVSDQATLNLFGPRVNCAIPFYGDAISCCAVSKPFGIAVGATNAGNLIISSLFEGTKVNVVSFGDGFRPHRIVVGDAWGFIITVAYKTVYPKCDLAGHIFVHNVNGRFVKSVPFRFQMKVWCSFASRRGFDYVIMGDENGELFLFEAMYPELMKTFYHCHRPVVGVLYLAEKGIFIIVARDGQVLLVPLIVDC
jgi:hypothetical protein